MIRTFRPGRGLVALVAVLAGAFGMGASPSPGGSTEATSPSPGASTEATSPVTAPAVVLRMEVGGGFAPLQASLIEVPVFTLYDDGRVIFRSDDPASDDGPLPPMRTAMLPQSAMDGLVARALDRFGLRDAREEYTNDRIADAETTVFTIAADGVDKTVAAYALGIGDDGRDRRIRRRLGRLASHLSHPGAWLPSEIVVTDYEPDAYRGSFVEDDPENPDATPWPWADLSPDDLQPLEDAVAFRQADLTPQQVALVTDVPNGGAVGIAIAAPDGQAAWRLSLRPLLPDEEPLPATEPPEATPSPTMPPPPSDGYDYDY